MARFDSCTNAMSIFQWNMNNYDKLDLFLIHLFIKNESLVFCNISSIIIQNESFNNIKEWYNDNVFY